MNKHVYILRTCSSDMTSYGGFKWPKRGKVEAPDFKPTCECGNGLHGFLWGEGSGSLADWNDNAMWLVVKVPSDKNLIKLRGKVKFKSGYVVFSGSRKDSTDKIIRLGASGAVVGCHLTGGDDATLTGGYRATLTGGDDATLTGGDDATLTGGDRATLTGGDRATLTGKHWDGCRYRMVTIYIGEDGIKPNTLYYFENGKFTEIEE